MSSASGIGASCAGSAWLAPIQRRSIMCRRLILTFSAITALGLGLLPGSGFSQQKTLKEQLVGTWMIFSYERMASGTKQTIANPKGILMFDAGGRYVMAGDRCEHPHIKLRRPAT